jgi:predicted Zn-dependent protease
LTAPAYERGRKLLEEGELAEAIWALLEALQEDPEELDGYFALMEAYELAYEVFPDPQLLQQVKNVLAGARDQALDEARSRQADQIERRIEARLAAL